MSSKGDFEERLNRIQQSRNGRADTPAPARPADHWQMPGRAGRKGGLPIAIIAAGVVSLGLMGIGALYFWAKLGLTEPYASYAELSANLDGTTPQAVQAGWLDRFFGVGLARDESGDPISFLPTAPAGWLRVTTADAQQPDALAQLAARWPEAGGRFDQHPGHGDVVEFIRIHDSLDMEQRALAETRTRALYLGPEGQSLLLRLRFRNTRDALGTAADPASWAGALRPEVEASAQQGETLEAFDLSGMTVFNRADPGRVGAAQRSAVTSLDLSVALHPRAVVELQGVARPGAAIALIEGFDRAALGTRLADQ